MKFRILQDPTFTVDVAIPRAGGATVDVSFTFKFLDRDQLAEYFEGQQKHRESVTEALKVGAAVRDITGTVIEHQVETLCTIVTDWGFDDKFTPKNVEALVRSFAAAPEAVMAAFAKGYDGARLGKLREAARALYEPQPDLNALAAFGFKPEDLPEMEVGLFPDNWASFLLFDGMATQWRTGAVGATGLDYAAMPVVFRSLGLPSSRRAQLFNDMRTMEDAALALFSETRGQGE